MLFAKKRRKRINFNRRKRLLLKKGIFYLPNIFTLGNAFFGFCSIVFAARSDFFSAANFILLGALMDALDGRIARLVGATSPIGLQLDSLADAISFCLAPAFLVYFWKLKLVGFLGLFVSSLFFMAGILRLARFNVIWHEQAIYFLGLPTTIAGCFLSVLYLNTRNIDNNLYFLVIIFIVILFLSFLMVSRFKFPAFKKYTFGFNKFVNLNNKWRKLALAFLLAFVFVFQFHKVLLMLFLFYFASAIFIKEKR